VECTLTGIKTYEDDDFRIRMLKQSELLEELERTGKTVKWGKYLRAPDVYFEILEKCRDKLVPLKEVAKLEYGIKTGIADFFLITDDVANHWGIEKEFLVPIVTSLKEIDTPVIKINDLHKLLFLCHLREDELRRRGKKGALSYIKWGSKQKTKGKGRVGTNEIPYPEVESVKNNNPWYAIQDISPGDFIINQFTGDRFFFPINTIKIRVTNTFFQGKIREKNQKDLMLSIINSTLTYLFVELWGRLTWTQGVLYTYGPDIKNFPILDMREINSKMKKKIINNFYKLLSRPIKSIFEEVKMRDRQKLDSLVLEALGLDPKKYLPRIYDGLCELVRERLQLARMRKKVKLVKTQRDVEKLIEQVKEEVIPEGFKKFPENFVDSRHIRDGKEISIPSEPLKLGHFFMGQQEVITEQGFKYIASSEDEAKFIIYSQKPDVFVVKIPKEPLIIQKAISDYEHYLKEIREKLYNAFFTRTSDYKLSETLTARVMEGK